MTPPAVSASVHPASIRIEADDLGFAYGDRAVLAGLSFRIDPGLTLLRGGDGRGKTTLLRLLAGELAPTAGRLVRRVPTVFGPELPAAAEDGLGARDWLRARRDRHPGWDAATEAGLVDAFGLDEHLGKTLFMLSTGSRRKLCLVAAFASRAGLVLIDTPFAGLDRPSSRRLSALLAQACEDPLRAVVIADHDLPEGVDPAALQGVVELGD